MTPPATASLQLAEAPTAVLRPLSPKLRTLLDVHVRVVGRTWRRARLQPDGARVDVGDGPQTRLRTELLTPVPPLERTPRP